MSPRPFIFHEIELTRDEMPTKISRKEYHIQKALGSLPTKERPISDEKAMKEAVNQLTVAFTCAGKAVETACLSAIEALRDMQDFSHLLRNLDVNINRSMKQKEIQNEN